VLQLGSWIHPFSDLIPFQVMALPLAMIKNTGFNTAKKIGLAVIFGLVVINIVFDILRTAFTLNRDLKRLPFEHNIWCHLQITTAIIVCALPCYGALLSPKPKPNAASLRIQKSISITTWIRTREEMIPL
jgi:hypothetical protein